MFTKIISAYNAGTLTFIKHPNEITPHVGYAPVCASCMYIFHCLHRNYPRVCGHCRTAIFISFVNQMTMMFMSQFDRFAVEYAYRVCQPPHHRVSSACPLFHVSSVKCIVCCDNKRLKHWRKASEVSQ